MNKRKLYESIMRNVAKEVKKAINEGEIFKETLEDVAEEIFDKYDYDCTIVRNFTPFIDALEELGFEPTGENLPENSTVVLGIIPEGWPSSNGAAKLWGQLIPEDTQSSGMSYSYEFNPRDWEKYGKTLIRYIERNGED